ncbi:hypothetical protein ACGFX4_13315 [Kitasatospora sp. NPDC048365]|uniref:hypothetical protein n=1 Tax=Kitasatospora sp. NPDC048365 TaxID=3364050 RepID=UPI003714A978
MNTVSAVLSVELCGGRWDGLRKRVRAGAPPPALRLVLSVDLPAVEAGEYWPTTSVYRLDEDGPVVRYRHSHDE